MTRCVKCHRRLTRDPGPMGMGPVCLRAAIGAKPRRIAREDRKSDDPRQMELLA